jgi:hypothetical protein
VANTNCIYANFVERKKKMTLKTFDVYLAGRISAKANNKEEAAKMVEKKLDLIHPMFNIQIVVTKEDYLDAGKDFKPEGTD